MPSGPSRLDTSYEFDEYGRRISPANTGGVESQKTFVGGMSVQDEVADTGLMMMGHRFYAPDLGRFLNRDPIGFRGGANLFEYAGSAPVRNTDPAGLFWPPVAPGYQFDPDTVDAYLDGLDSGEMTQGQVEFILGFNPVVGLGLSGRDFYDDPTVWTGGILLLSALGLRGPALGAQAAMRGVSSNFLRLSAAHTAKATRASGCLLGKIATLRNVTHSPTLGKLASFAIGADHITWGADVLKFEAIEEFLHGTLVRIGKDVGSLDPEEILKIERYVKGFMVRHQRMLGLTDIDISLVKETLLTYERKYGKVKP